MVCSKTWTAGICFPLCLQKVAEATVAITVYSRDKRLVSGGDVGSTHSGHFSEQAANIPVKVTYQFLVAIHLLQSD